MRSACTRRRPISQRVGGLALALPGRGACGTSTVLARDDLIQIKGTIVEALAGGNYRVKGDNGMEFLAKIGGRMRRYHIRVIPGDRVTIAVSPYDPSHGLIVFRGG